MLIHLDNLKVNRMIEKIENEIDLCLFSTWMELSHAEIHPVNLIEKLSLTQMYQSKSVDFRLIKIFRMDFTIRIELERRDRHV
jgi:hypothetical protein